MTLGIIGAMQEEIQPVLNYLGDCEKEEYVGYTFYIKQYKKVKVVLVQSKIGKVASAMLTTLLIQRYQIDQLLFTGVAGALNEDLNIGDIVISKDLCQYDVDITAFGHKLGFVSGERIYEKANEQINKKLEEIAKNNNINYQVQTIATGDSFIHDKKVKEKIKKEFNAYAVEMEGAPCAFVCNRLNVPFTIIRSISDTVNGNQMEYEEFKVLAAKNSAKIITEYISNVSN